MSRFSWTYAILSWSIFDQSKLSNLAEVSLGQSLGLVVQSILTLAYAHVGLILYKALVKRHISLSSYTIHLAVFVPHSLIHLIAMGSDHMISVRETCSIEPTFLISPYNSGGLPTTAALGTWTSKALSFIGLLVSLC